LGSLRNGRLGNRRYVRVCPQNAILSAREVSCDLVLACGHVVPLLQSLRWCSLGLCSGIVTTRWYGHHRWFSLGVAGGVGWMLWSSAPVCQAIEAHRNVGGYTIDVWQVEQGLPQISVTSIAQTPDGYLWFGTFNGLVRFDGARFTVFNEANTPVLGSSGIFRLLTDLEGGLWILTEDGQLTCLVGDEFTAFGPENGLPACGAAALVVDLEGQLWVVDREGGSRATAGPARNRGCWLRRPSHAGWNYATRPSTRASFP
jgi:hypothetical protein